MPELPEVETVKNGIEKAIGNSLIVDVKVFNRKFREPIPETFEKIVSGSKIIKYKRIGKYLVIDLSNQKSIIWHLGMSGKVKILDTKPHSLEKHDHVVINTDNGTLIFNDTRRFGVLTVEDTKNLLNNKYLHRMGVDPFDTKFTDNHLFDKLKNKKIPIKVALLDQTIVAGIGNIYASEILYDAGISPLRESDKVTKKECESLVKSTRKILQKAIENGGSTLRDYQKPDGSLGYFQNLHAVYNKEGHKCPNCTCDINKNGGIKKIVQAGRSTFYCPILQK